MNITIGSENVKITYPTVAANMNMIASLVNSVILLNWLGGETPIRFAMGIAVKERKSKKALWIGALLF